ncbi:hypothetical protein COU54_05435 [Candidatus Pacearchaeota archaeon CG10_big_fil_rev_8_21_14_0_10_31_24]|nr:MAG: hypothetical protein COU54_05435 [Candidatus Pacearchaeota archaeon CG10_big_fil_rev_8_21_14_0_10_31_24]
MDREVQSEIITPTRYYVVTHPFHLVDDLQRKELSRTAIDMYQRERLNDHIQNSELNLNGIIHREPLTVLIEEEKGNYYGSVYSVSLFYEQHEKSLKIIICDLSQSKNPTN